MAECLSSNAAEGFFAVVAMLSGGKRLCLEHTDLWRSMILLGFCRSGNIERTHEQLWSALNLDVLGPAKRNLAKWQRKREKDRARVRGEEGEKRRHEEKALKDRLMMKEDSKKRHKSGKVPVSKSAKVGKTRLSRCGVCKVIGHNCCICPLPPLPKLSAKAELLDWSDDAPAAVKKSRAKKYEADMIDWSA